MHLHCLPRDVRKVSVEFVQDGERRFSGGLGLGPAIPEWRWRFLPWNDVHGVVVLGLAAGK